MSSSTSTLMHTFSPTPAKPKLDKLTYHSTADNPDLELSEAEEEEAETGKKTRYVKLKNGYVDEGTYGAVHKFAAKDDPKKIICIKREKAQIIVSDDTKEPEVKEPKKAFVLGPAFHRDALVHKIIYGHGSLGGESESITQPRTMGMDYIQGDRLDRIAINSPSQYLAICFFVIYRLMEDFHARGIVHGDIHAKNILIESKDHKWIIHILDFNLARFIDDPKEKTLGGRADWHAFELAKKISPDFSQDVYSLGYLFRELYKKFKHCFISSYPGVEPMLLQLFMDMMTAAESRITLEEAFETLEPFFSKSDYSENFDEVLRNRDTRQKCQYDLTRLLNTEDELVTFFGTLRYAQRKDLLQLLGIPFLKIFNVEESNIGCFIESHLNFTFRESVTFLKNLEKEYALQLASVLKYYQASYIENMVKELGGLRYFRRVLNIAGSLDELAAAVCKDEEGKLKFHTLLTIFAKELIAASPNLTAALKETDLFQTDDHYQDLLLIFNRMYRKQLNKKIKASCCFTWRMHKTLEASEALEIEASQPTESSHLLGRNNRALENYKGVMDSGELGEIAKRFSLVR